MFIQEGIKDGTFELVWSYVVDFENDANPYPRRKRFVSAWKSFAVIDVGESEELLVLMESFEKRGVKSKDALHLAAAIVGQADFFITTDRGILNKSINKISVMNPERFVRHYEEVTNNE